MAYSYFETTVQALESAKRTVSGVDYYDLSYTNLDYTPLFSTTQVEADKYVSDVGDTLQVTLGDNTLDRSSNTDLWIVNPSNNRVEINTSDSAWTSLNPQNSDIVRLSRISKKDAPYVDYANAAVLTEQDLDAQAKQSLHIVQESIDIANDGLTLSTDGKWDGASGGSNRNIKNVATPSSSDPSHYVATKGYVDGSSSSQTVASISDEITTVAGISSKVETVAGAIKETIAYTVDVANSVFRIQGGEFSSATEKPALNLQRGSTYTFNYTHSSISSGSHVLGFSSANTNTNNSGAVAYTTGITDDTVNKIITFVVPSSAPDTLYYYCTAHAAMGNTMNIAEDSVEVVADNIANVNLLGPKATEIGNLGTSANVTNMATLGASGVVDNIATVADSTYKTKVETVADSAYKAKVETVADSTYKGKVETVAGDTTAINSIHTNISQVTTFADTYHTAGTTEPSGSNVTEGDLWFDTANDVLKVYDGSSWGSATSSISSVASTSEFTASDGQGTDSKYFAVNHDVGLELVFLNGVRLKRGSDYYCTNSNTSTTPIATSNAATFVRLETVPGSSDILSVMAFGQIANNLAVNTAGGTFTGAVTFEGQNTHNTGSNTFTMPTTRGTDNYVLTRDDSVGTGGTTWKETALSPTISSIKYSEQTSGTFVENTGQTATEASATTPELCQIIGTNFDNSMTISVAGTSAGSIVINSSTQATFTPPSKTAGSYTLTVTNPSGLTGQITIAYDADPGWVTGVNADLGDFVDGTISGTNGPQIIASEGGSNLTTGYKQVTSNTDNTVITSGIAGLTIGDNGYLTGTLAGTNGAQNNFYAIAVDNEGQQSAIRQFHFVSYDYPASVSGYTPSSITGFLVYVFNTTGETDFVVHTALTNVEYLVIGGGGGGASYGTGYANGGHGSPSYIRNLANDGNLVHCTGGGGGAALGDSDAADGYGSGGGGRSGTSGTGGGNGKANEGYAGGDGSHQASPTAYAGGGGGGAGHPGQDGSGTQNGAGGIGLSSSITGDAIGRAGGGGAGGWNTNNEDPAYGGAWNGSTVSGSGSFGGTGAFGAGNGGEDQKGGDATANTGSGGGAGDSNAGASHGGGGAGGYRCSVPGESSGGGASAETRLSMSAGTYKVGVGTGGAGGSTHGGAGGSGVVIIRIPV